MAEQQLKSRVGEPFNIFISLEVGGDHRSFVSEVEELQERTLNMFPEQNAKAAKLHSLHVTLATLSVKEDEMAFVIQSVADAVDQFKKIYSGEDGIRANFQGISTWNDVVFLNMGLGANAFKTLWDTMMVNGLRRFQTDLTDVNPHLTFVRKLDLTEAEKGAMMTTLDDTKTSRITLDVLSLRQRKQAGEPLQPPVRQFALWKE